MTSSIVNRRDLDFLLYEVLGIQSLLKTPKYADHDRESISAILDVAEGIANEHFLPCAAKLDANEPEFDGEKVSIIPEVGEALKVYADSGFFAAGFDEELGGLQLPEVVTTGINGIFACANIGIAAYPFLTIAAANLLKIYGSEQQKEQYLPNMLAGNWFGTMCLSEPHAGSSLSDIRTKAVANEDGTYEISGTKMWISGGDHEISENIVHLVLAKIPGGPPGVKGISLFLVPKYRLDENGDIGDRNDVVLAGLNHKMGSRGTVNTLLNFGENDDCTGYLIGEPHKGLFYMFQMMNEARIGVGCNSVMSGLAGYLYSLDYAKNRPQGRHPEQKDPTADQVMIIEHADIKRLLMAQKAYVEGAYQLVLYCAKLVDIQKTTQSEEEKQHVSLLLEFLTPIAKSWPSEYCLEANKHAIQILGGYGYTREYPVERYYRDNRLNHIHEGAHGIHGIDLLGRKAVMFDGAALKILAHEVGKTLTQAGEIEGLTDCAAALNASMTNIQLATEASATCADKIVALANATLYLDAVGHVIIAWLWLQQAISANNAMKSENCAEQDFYEGKVKACHYFFRYELPHADTKLKLVASMDDTCASADSEQFISCH